MADLLVQIKWHMLSQEKKQETLQRGMHLERKRKYKGVVQEDLFVTNNYGVCFITRAAETYSKFKIMGAQ